ncbi:hypothetical protein [Nonomuraea lactucae]|uniref:hypothetical protein n=1 Tax=Nonomuraea lactucae TaxID=2249762 RepID=UPI000DE32999|nr:hypothetical protein [Nonomuraea lactucae]
MFKRRFAILGAVAALTLTGLGGSALASDEPPATPARKITCTTSDGKTFEFPERIRALKAVKGTNGKIVMEEGEAPDGVTPTVETKPETAVRGERLPEEGIVEAVPAEPATGADAPTLEPAEDVDVRRGEPGVRARAVEPPADGKVVIAEKNGKSFSISCKAE